jgi:trehalose 6-phosphate phosphatase
MYLSEGKLIVEIRVPLPVHKGRAIRQFVERYNLNAIVFAGDDRTDLDAVTEIIRMRTEGIAACSIVVQHHDTLPELLTQADILVHEVPGMVELLYEMVTILESNQ